jgi:hypothetical protein
LLRFLEFKFLQIYMQAVCQFETGLAKGRHNSADTDLFGGFDVIKARPCRLSANSCRGAGAAARNAGMAFALVSVEDFGTADTRIRRTGAEAGKSLPVLALRIGEIANNDCTHLNNRR